MKIYTNLIKLFLILIIGSLVGCFIFEVKNDYYSDYSSAINSQSFRGGWLPRLLPKSAHLIYDQKDVESNDFLLKFSFTINDYDLWTKDCLIAFNNIKLPTGFIPKWWGNDIFINNTPNYLNYSFFVCKETKNFIVERSYLAISKKENLAFYWRNGKNTN